MSGYSKIPNWIFDDVMPRCDSSEWRVVCAVARQTFGWDKEADEISISQFEKLTGMSRATVVKAVKAALDHGFLVREKQGRSHVYRVSIGLESKPIDDADEFRNYTDNSLDSKPIDSLDSKHTKERVKDKERKKIEPEPGHPVWQMPEPLNSGEFENTWIAWYKHLLELGKPLTQTTGDMQLKQLAEWGQQRAIAAIEHSITRGWRSIHEPQSTNGVVVETVTRAVDGGVYV